jgi:hypothetical protein
MIAALGLDDFTIRLFSLRTSLYHDVLKVLNCCSRASLMLASSSISGRRL